MSTRNGRMGWQGEETKYLTERGVELLSEADYKMVPQPAGCLFEMKDVPVSMHLDSGMLHSYVYLYVDRRRRGADPSRTKRTSSR